MSTYDDLLESINDERDRTDSNHSASFKTSKCKLLKLFHAILTSVAIYSMFVMVGILFVSLNIYYTDLDILIKDAKINMADLGVIIPKVAETLRLVDNICQAPEYKYYCHANSTLFEASDL